jgi:hypothetical protein
MAYFRSASPDYSPNSTEVVAVLVGGYVSHRLPENWGSRHGYTAGGRIADALDTLFAAYAPSCRLFTTVVSVGQLTSCHILE